jgi:hypothetical protein
VILFFEKSFWGEVVFLKNRIDGRRGKEIIRKNSVKIV